MPDQLALPGKCGIVQNKAGRDTGRDMLSVSAHQWNPWDLVVYGQIGGPIVPGRVSVIGGRNIYFGWRSYGPVNGI